MTLPLNALRTFEAVARHLSFTQGAEELGVTQSAASHQIRNLEEYLSASLFDRNGRQLVLTEAGVALYQGVQEGLAVLDRAVDGVKHKSVRRPFAIHTRPHFALKWLAPRLVRFWQRNPGFDLRLQHDNLPADFSDRSLDLAIDWLRHDQVGANGQLLLAGNLTPACGPALLSAVQGPLRPGDLADYPLLHEADEQSWRDWLAGAGVADLVAVRNHYYDDTNVRQEAAISGEGFALVCPDLVRDELADGRLVCPFPFHLDSYAYYLVTPAQGAETPATKKVVRWLLEEAGRMR